ncbi:MAG: hypothetical protein CMP14_04715 [Rickettsiales bacterium]|nr:hypothetical protein [Rickettsiales bacterium]|tara:strand:- start:471 stop:857 length:387 start_codon:yes stop_codon:yes gene_type:complete
MEKLAGDRRLRIDKWLWYARFFKSRNLSAKLAASGRLRVNRKVVYRSKHTVQPGDILTFPKGKHIRVIEVVALGERRGPAAEAQMLYRDLSPPQTRLEEQLIAERYQKTSHPSNCDRQAIKHSRRQSL